jgi:hypothetical protein
VHIFIKHVNGKNPPHCRIRRDNGDIEMLNGRKFYDAGQPIGWRLSAEEFLQRLEQSQRRTDVVE